MWGGGKRKGEKKKINYVKCINCKKKKGDCNNFWKFYPGDFIIKKTKQ